jgi:hypothetical protein
MDAETVAILFFLLTLAVLAGKAFWHTYGYAFRPRRHYKLEPNYEPDVPDSACRPYSAASR